MAVTLLTARTAVRDILDESSAGFWTDAQLNNWINTGCEDVARKAEVLWQERDFAVIAGVQNYPFPSDFLSCHRAEFTIAGLTGPGAQTINMEYRSINTMDSEWGILHSLPSAWPRYFTIRGNSTMGYYLMMYPSPGANGTMTVYYYRQAVAAGSDTANIDTMPGWEDTVYEYAVYQAKRKARDPSWQEALQLYNMKLEAMINKTRNMTDLGENVTSQGYSSWPAYAYDDGSGY